MRFWSPAAWLFAASVSITPPAAADAVLARVTRLQDLAETAWIPGDRIEAVVAADGQVWPVRDLLDFRLVEIERLPVADLQSRGSRELRLREGEVQFAFAAVADGTERGALAASLATIEEALRTRAWQPANAACEKALASKDTGLPEGRALVHLACARAYIAQRNQPDAAVRHAERGLASVPAPRLLRAQLLEALTGALIIGEGTRTQREAAVREARDIVARHAPRSLQYARLLHREAQIAAIAGDVPAALAYSDQALALHADRPSGTATAELHFVRALLFEQLERTDDSLAAARAAVDISERVEPGSVPLARYLSQLSGSQRGAGKIAEAEATATRAVTVLVESGGDPIALSEAYTAVGNIQTLRGDIRAAQASYEDALAATLKVDRNLTGARYHNLGVTAIARGDLTAAHSYLASAIEVKRRNHPDSLTLARSLYAMSRVLAQLGDPAGAIPLLEEAAGIEVRIAPEGPTHALAQTTLASLWLRLGDTGRADAALAVATRNDAALPADDLTRVRLLRERGVLELARGRAAESKAVLDEGLRIATLHADSSLQEAGLLQDRAEAWLALGSAFEAAQDLERALQVLQADAQDSVDLARAWYLMGRTSAARNQTAAAREQFCRASNVLDRVRVPVGEDSFALSRFRAQFITVYQACLDALMTAGDTRRAFETLERLRGRAFLNALQARDVILPEPALPSVSTAASLSAALPTDTVVLSYAVLEQRTWVFRVTRDDVQAFEVDRGGAELERDVAGFRALIARNDAGDLAQLKRQGVQLYARLVGPALQGETLPGTLLIAPDGALHSLPWGALVDPADERWLIEKQPLAIIDSLSIETRVGARAKGSPEEFLGVADASSTTLQLPPLPAARAEVERAARHFGRKARVLLGTQATEAQTRALAASSGTIHFAVHATLDTQRPLESAIELSPRASGQADDDGRLQLWEVLEQLSLQAGMVVLSGCETAIGPQLLGEGLFGFARAFRFAGAARVVATLWPVQDRATAHLMEEFYTARESFGDEALALRAAVSGTLRPGLALARSQTRGVGRVRARAPSSAARAAHPFYWAAFQVYGARLAN